jgi:hypothetical protein
MAWSLCLKSSRADALCGSLVCIGHAVGPDVSAYVNRTVRRMRGLLKGRPSGAGGLLQQARLESQSWARRCGHRRR